MIARTRRHSLARALVLAAAALLFLDAAATLHVTYTLRISYLLCVVACIVGADGVAQGIARAPRSVLVSGIALFAVYAAAALADHPLALPGQPRTGVYRAIVYLGDLTVGLATFALVIGLFRSARDVRRLLAALVLGATVAAAYGCYQWAAQRYGLRFADINNTQDSNGITAGANQGSGLFGWERARGTFIEPHFFGVYLVTMLPLCLGAAAAARRPALRLGAAGAAALCLCGISVTDSVPAVGVGLMGLAIAVTAIAIGRGAVVPAGIAAAVTAVIVLVTPILIASPTAISGLTGRAAGDVALTTAFRTDTWRRAEHIWRHRPLLGYGPGQSAVQLTAETDRPVAFRPAAPGPLQSAQGVWAASLVDAGLFGLAASLFFVISVLGIAVRAVVRCAEPVPSAVAAAAVVAVAASEIAGDRIELRAWLVAGLAIAVATGSERGEQRTRANDEADGASARA